MKVLYACVSLLWLVSCGNSEHAGTSTETTNGVAGILLQGGHPLARAALYAYDPSGEILAAEVETDSTGEFVLTLPSEQLAPGTSLHLWARSADSSTMVLRYHARWGQDTSMALELLPAASMQLTGIPRGQSIRLLGTPFHAIADSAGVAHFPALPAGSYTAADPQGARGSLLLLPGQNRSHPLGTPGLVLEDFADGNDRHTLYPWSGDGNWYISTRNGGVILWPPNPHRLSSALITQGAWSDYSLHVEYELGLPESSVPLPEPGVQVGLYLAEQPLDLTGLDTLRFMAKGDGLLSVAIETEISPDEFRKAIWERQLTGEWEEIVIATDEPIASPNYLEHLPFPQVAGRARLLTFFFKSGTFFTLDEVRLQGVDAEVFLPTGQLPPR